MTSCIRLVAGQLKGDLYSVVFVYIYIYNVFKYFIVTDDISCYYCCYDCVKQLQSWTDVAVAMSVLVAQDKLC